MESEVYLGLGAIVVLGVGCQWLARLARFPSIVLLLLAGILAGPVLDVVEPEELFGEALFPGVTLAVGLLLFDAGLGLRLEDLRGGTRRPVIRLVTVGTVVTWLGAATSAFLIFDFTWDQCLLLGAVLVVSGPTVVGPILSIVRPREPVSSILSWEGTFMDPIGATLGIVVLNVFVLEGTSTFAQGPDTILVGVGVGLAAAALLVGALRLFLVPDDLEVAVGLFFAVGAFTGAELLLSEAGLFATTVMGVAVANQPWVTVKGISFFHRSLGNLIIGSLFVVLAASLDLSDLVDVLPLASVFVGVLVLVVRPLDAFLSTLWSPLGRHERAFVGWMAPRGIVAAATASTFALQIQNNGGRFAELVPVTFAVIIGTAIVYGLSALPVARLLGVARGAPKGVALVGRRPWLLALAEELSSQDVEVTVVATGGYDLAGREHDYELYTGPLDERQLASVFDGTSHVLVASDNAEHDKLAIQLAIDAIGRAGVYVPAEHGHHDISVRHAFGGTSDTTLERDVAAGARFVTLGADDPGPATDDVVFARIGADETLDLSPRARPAKPGERTVVLAASVRTT